jgi:aconitate hydratase
MMRGTFANIRLRNRMVPGKEGGFTRLQPQGDEMPLFDAAMAYRQQGIPLVIVAGKEYGTGSSRDWAAKGTLLLGVKAVLAESYERIHRSNLVGMGVLPLQFKPGENQESLGLDGSETFDLPGQEEMLGPGQELTLTVTRSSGERLHLTVICRIDTANEVAYYRNGGILNYVLQGLMA